MLKNLPRHIRNAIQEGIDYRNKHPNLDDAQLEEARVLSYPIIEIFELLKHLPYSLFDYTRFDRKSDVVIVAHKKDQTNVDPEFWHPGTIAQIYVSHDDYLALCSAPNRLNQTREMVRGMDAVCQEVARISGRDGILPFSENFEPNGRGSMHQVAALLRPGVLAR